MDQVPPWLGQAPGRRAWRFVARLRKGQRPLFAAQAEERASAHPPLASRGKLVLLRSKNDPRVRRWQRADPQRQLVHTPEQKHFLREIGRSGGKLPVSRRRVERAELHQLVSQGLIHLEQQPAHHLAEFLAVLTKQGKRVHRAIVAADKAAHGAQPALFKGGRMRFIINLAKADQLGLFGGKGPAKGGGVTVATRRGPTKGVQQTALGSSNVLHNYKLKEIRAKGLTVEGERLGELVPGHQRWRTTYKLRRYAFRTPKGYQPVRPREILVRQAAVFQRTRSKKPPFYDMGERWVKQGREEYLDDAGHWRPLRGIEDVAQPKPGTLLRPRRVPGRTVEGHYVADIPCDPRCLNARGHKCECSCGGANHGAGMQMKWKPYTERQIQKLLAEHGPMRKVGA